MKNKGGRGKKAGYETVVMRIPEPLHKEVARLVEHFHASVSVSKPVTGIESSAINKPVTGIGQMEELPLETKKMMHLTTLNLPKRIVNALNRRQINTIGDLIIWRDCDLLVYEGVGKESVRQIEAALAKEFDLTLRVFGDR